MAINHDNVERLISAALEGFATIESSADDALSASFTLTRRMIAAAIQMNPATREVLLSGVRTLMMECADTGGRPN